MNRYPLWKYIVIAVALVVGLVYTTPNFFGEAPAVQVSSAKATIKVDNALRARVESTLAAATVEVTGMFFDGNSIKARFKDTDTQLKARDLLDNALNPNKKNPIEADRDEPYTVALNLLSNTPKWLTSLRALPMYLGLDLRGGVHFLYQVDMKAALTKKLDSLTGDMRTLLRDKNVRHAGIERQSNGIVVKFRDEPARVRARELVGDAMACASSNRPLRFANGLRSGPATTDRNCRGTCGP